MTQHPENTQEPEQTLRLPDMQSKVGNEVLTQPTRPATEAYIGSYRLVRSLDSGAFGVVYLAYQPFLNRQVALKVLRAELSADPQAERHFMHEARTIAKLRHPNIVTVYEFGTAPALSGSRTYMVMEYLPGETLYARLKRERLALVQVIEIVEQLASALEYASVRNVIHRDLKPANIIFSEQQQPVIVDFGLARLVEISVNHESPEPSVQTRTPSGTPAYMAPEQAAGEPGGPASDQYALAVITYEMLTGKRAYTANTLADTLKAKLENEPPSLSQAARELPSEADAVMRRAMHRDPAARYPTAGAFARALGEALLPDRVAGKVVPVTDPVQAAQLRSARQTIFGFLWGLVLLTLIVILFSIALFIRSFMNFDPPFMWDGILASTTMHDGLRDVIAVWPGSPAQQAGVQAGDTIQTDLTYDRLEKNGDYMINGLPRSAYPVNWLPQEGDRINRTILRDGAPMQVSYPIRRSGYQLIALSVQIPPAIVALVAVAWLLKRWGTEPGVQLIAVALLAGGFGAIASAVTYVVTNLDVLAEFTFLPLLLHWVLVFPEPVGWIKAAPRRIWLLYLPVLLGLVEFFLGALIFDRFNMIIYSGYVGLLILAVILKWGRHDLKHYPAMKPLMWAALLAGITALLAEAVSALDDYATVKTIWNGNGLATDLVSYGIVTIGATMAVLLATLGFHRVQQVLGRSLPPSPDPIGKSPHGW